MNTRRLAKELGTLQASPPEGVTGVEVVTEGVEWLIGLRGPPDSLYAGEEFKLRFIFSGDYPLDSPQVTFQTPNVPKHPHCYTNGHICLSILYDQWSPALTAGSVALSVLSMLASSTEKEAPEDNERYVRSAKANPKMTTWVFHDDK